LDAIGNYQALVIQSTLVMLLRARTGCSLVCDTRLASVGVLPSRRLCLHTVLFGTQLCGDTLEVSFICQNIENLCNFVFISINPVTVL